MNLLQNLYKIFTFDGLKHSVCAILTNASRNYNLESVEREKNDLCFCVNGAASVQLHPTWRESLPPQLQVQTQTGPEME